MKKIPWEGGGNTLAVVIYVWEERNNWPIAQMIDLINDSYFGYGGMKLQKWLCDR